MDCVGDYYFMRVLLALLILIPSLSFAKHQDSFVSESDLSFCQYIHSQIEWKKHMIESNRELKVDSYEEKLFQHEENILKSFDELSNLIISYDYFCK